MFDLLFHADWSITGGKRWMARAERRAAGWAVEPPELVGATGTVLDRAFRAAGEGQRVLFGFDFPIGVPAAYGRRAGIHNFPDLLKEVGEGSWSQFFKVAETAGEIGIHRPFYPAASKKGVLRADLVKGLGVSSFEQLYRICERKTMHSPGACSLFWTLGGNQVGKGALSGWKEMIRPAILRGAALWPFDGTLETLAPQSGVVLAETYPAVAYHMVNAGFLPAESKRSQADRRTKGPAVRAWAERHAVALADNAKAALDDGFGAASNGEDQFDAFMGLLKMIEVVDGRRPERTESATDTAAWEGWILGR